MRKKKKNRGSFRGKTGQTMEDMVLSALANSQYKEEVDRYFAAPEHDNCGTPECCTLCDDEGLNWDSLVPLPTKAGK